MGTVERDERQRLAAELENAAQALARAADELERVMPLIAEALRRERGRLGLPPELTVLPGGREEAGDAC